MTQTHRLLFDNAQALTAIAREMHITGMPVDMDRREEHRVRLQKEMTVAAEAFAKHTGLNTKLTGEVDAEEDSGVSISSNKELTELFFNRYGVEPQTFNEDTGEPSLDKGVLRALLSHGSADVRTAAELLLAYRQASTTESRYIGAGYYTEPDHYGLRVLRSTGRHHPTFGVCAAETLRFTCQGGAHQMQKDTYAENKEGKVVVTRKGTRDIFVAPKGWLWLETDYSALELREFALYGAIMPWLERFQSGGDVHKWNAALALKMTEAQIDKGKRDVIKTCTFGGMCYGGADSTVHTQVVNKYPRLKLEMISEFKRNLYTAVPRIPEYQHEAIREARELGYTPLATGDKIQWKFPAFHDEKGTPIMYGEPKSTEILNKRMQKTGARIINANMVKVHAALDPKKCKIVLQLHDALHALVREDSVREQAKVFTDHMEQELVWSDKHGKRSVWLCVEQKLGPSWGELKDYKP